MRAILTKKDAQNRVEQERRKLAQLEEETKQAQMRLNSAESDFILAEAQEQYARSHYTEDMWKKLQQEASPYNSVLVGQR